MTAPARPYEGALSLAQRLRVYAIDDGSITVTMTAETARNVADALDGQPFRVSIFQGSVVVSPINPSEHLRVYLAITAVFMTGEIARLFL